MLNEVGWDITKPNVTEYEVTGMPNDQNTGYADYVLWGDDGRPLAVVEAKRTSVSPKAGQHQAKLYADALEEMHGQRPVIFYSNGYESFIWDDQFYPPRPVQGFYKKDELQRLITRRGSRKDITQEPVNKNIADRYYQEAAIRHTAETYTRNARGALLVMATGTGKTRVAIAAVEMLMKASWVKRVLFLADRTALVRQARNRFSEHLPNISLCNLLEEKEDANTRIVFSTYPTIMNAIDDTRNDSTKIFGPGHFDLIMIDEAHRSVYQKYGAIFEYFDAILFGLTATPKTDIDHNTYHLFNLEDHMPTYAYEIDKAVTDGFLVPPKAISVPLKFQRDGIKYDELSEEEKAEYESEFRDEETGYIPEEIGSSALNNWLFNADTVDKVLGCLMEKGIKVQGGDKLGKSIIFAKSHKHAEFIEERFNKVFPQYRGSFLQIIDNQVKYAQNRIDTFSDKDKEPTIAVSVDMLDTGIDIPEIVNLVFFKIVRSKAKFWQMIGRGTRLCPDLFAPGENKSHFVIFDFCQNFEFFDENPEGIEGKAPESLSRIIFLRRLSIAHKLQSATYQQDEECKKLYISLLDTMHSETEGIDRDSFTARPHLRYIDEFITRERWDNLTLTDISDITEHISHLPATHEEDELAKRFDLLILNMQLSLLEYGKSQDYHILKVVSIASSLEKKGNIRQYCIILSL
jgi:type I restriction enzyme R subunit